MAEFVGKLQKYQHHLMNHHLYYFIFYILILPYYKMTYSKIVSWFDWLRLHLVFFRYYVGRRAVVVVADPEMLRQVMVRDFSSFPNRMVRTSTHL